MASVLLIEDESLIRMMIADMLAELGHSVAGEANDLQSGLSLASMPGIDAAILDIQLGAHSSERIAETLQSNGVPFAFASGYGAGGVPEGFSKYPVLEKPFPIEELERCLASLLR
ncbi:response regulator [Bradyrhizobium sp. WSM471]|uniref:response regulator n=1 Tax=Bradyrhizobium sp. WSM471 TaxID=319017 RepID=UPI00024D1A88|nr:MULTISPECIES: response regulator [Bradyrhizobium]EHQ99515.1 response regulator with CheY-like receiver domain and winged-helix DNA-binding domain [Bradyrhizobium sp. WSM471]UFW41675.1 response regulator [Bradyrhizobium canariense]